MLGWSWRLSWARGGCGCWKELDPVGSWWDCGSGMDGEKNPKQPLFDLKHGIFPWRALMEELQHLHAKHMKLFWEIEKSPLAVFSSHWLKSKVFQGKLWM